MLSCRSPGPLDRPMWRQRDQSAQWPLPSRGTGGLPRCSRGARGSARGWGPAEREKGSIARASQRREGIAAESRGAKPLRRRLASRMRITTSAQKRPANRPERSMCLDSTTVYYLFLWSSRLMSVESFLSTSRIRKPSEGGRRSEQQSKGILRVSFIYRPNVAHFFGHFSAGADIFQRPR